MKQLVRCGACGWVMLAYSRAEAEADVARFNAYFASLTPQQQQDYYRGQPASIHRYEHCCQCGASHHQFQPIQPNDCPMGVTILPIIQET